MPVEQWNADFVGTVYTAGQALWEHYLGRCSPDTMARLTESAIYLVKNSAAGGAWVEIITNGAHTVYCWAGA